MLGLERESGSMVRLWGNPRERTKGPKLSARQ